MSPKQIGDLLKEVSEGQLDALRVVDFAMERLIYEGGEQEINGAIDIIGDFLTGATIKESKIGI